MVLKNPIVFLDIRIGPEKGKSWRYNFFEIKINNCFFIVGRLIVELRKDAVPKTVENFRCLITVKFKLKFMNIKVYSCLCLI